jgi:hypothetical protein
MKSMQEISDEPDGKIGTEIHSSKNDLAIAMSLHRIVMRNGVCAPCWKQLNIEYKITLTPHQ